eukprot:jgi/Astpho2/359/Aster-x0436
MALFGDFFADPLLSPFGDLLLGGGPTFGNGMPALPWGDTGRGRGRRGGPPNPTGPSGIPVDLIELPDNMVSLHADAAQLVLKSKDKINVVIDGDVLRISVDRTEDEDKEKAVFHRNERPKGFLTRTTRMPKHADLDQSEAKYDAGVLILNIPKKKEEPAGKRIELQ